MEEYNTLDDFDLEGKTVLLRVDFNMPLDKNTLEILDTTRIKRALPTIKELIEKNAKTVILAHQGRQGSWDFTSLEKHAKALGKLLNHKVQFVDDIYGEKAKNAIKNLKNGEVLVLDNVRKFDGETEKKTAEEHAQSELVQNLYPLADVFVNDAFAAAHRAQCSLIGFTAVLPSCAGRLMEKELSTLEKIIVNPEKPSVFLFGGAKFSDVVVTINRLLENKTADKILLTGLPANAFLKAKGVTLGEKNEELLAKEGSPEIYNEIKELLDKHGENIYLPVDFAVEENTSRSEISFSELPTPYYIYDIGDKTIQKFKDILSTAKTVFLSGPCGVFEKPSFMKGTKEIFTYVANAEVFSIIGGGHTVAAVEQLGLTDKISHISTGGGSLEKFMMGEKLPVVEALKSAKKIVFSR
ncbi:MAG: phosphoglycerate kinase [Thermoplasmata archaeon]|nr:MAG: phosphoglycerate kinase [Thermoplasmata archaeon]RLF37444.1 MAG: phosphoglycerate kinase [Thermoplasmata archaeon]RLF52316.1 MAG: phosphoglycerate kinase [Thermoplasmata archaeon]